MLDVSASYPNGGSVFNISKETTKKEMCRVEGVSDYITRHEGINVSGGVTNAVEYMCMMTKLPNMPTMLDAFLASEHCD